MKNNNEKKTWKQPEWKTVKAADLTKSTAGGGTDGGGVGSTQT
jgi:hypothetical protein